MEPFISEIRLFTWNFAPKGWLLCDGSALNPTNTNYQALYMLIGTTYGGDGKTTFNLPDLRGRVPVCSYQNNPQLPLAANTYALGTADGFEGVALNNSQIQIHSHQVNASHTAAADRALINGSLPGKAQGSGNNATKNIYAIPPANQPTVALATDTVSSFGGGMAHANMQPFLVLNFCIAYQGIWPPKP